MNNKKHGSTPLSLGYLAHFATFYLVLRFSSRPAEHAVIKTAADPASPAPLPAASYTCSATAHLPHSSGLRLAGGIQKVDKRYAASQDFVSSGTPSSQESC